MAYRLLRPLSVTWTAPLQLRYAACGAIRVLYAFAFSSSRTHSTNRQPRQTALTVVLTVLVSGDEDGSKLQRRVETCRRVAVEKHLVVAERFQKQFHVYCGRRNELLATTGCGGAASRRRRRIRRVDAAAADDDAVANARANYVAVAKVSAYILQPRNRNRTKPSSSCNVAIYFPDSFVANFHHRKKCVTLPLKD